MSLTEKYHIQIQNIIKCDRFKEDIFEGSIRCPSCAANTSSVVAVNNCNMSACRKNTEEHK